MLMINIVDWDYKEELFGGIMTPDFRYIYGLAKPKDGIIWKFKPVVIYKMINSNNQDAFKGIFEAEYDIDVYVPPPTPELLYEILSTSFVKLATDELRKRGENSHVFNDTISINPFPLVKDDLEEIIQQTFRS